jgi:hypothetical protein
MHKINNIIAVGFLGNRPSAALIVNLRKNKYFVLKKIIFLQIEIFVLILIRQGVAF